MTEASVQDRDGARMLLKPLNSIYSWWKQIWADGGYSGKLVKDTARLDRHRQIDLEIVTRSDDFKGFQGPFEAMDGGENVRLTDPIPQIDS